MEYNKESIKSLNSIEHIRLRPGMYIGAVGNGEYFDDGIYVMLKEILDNSIDENISGYGKRININIESKKIKIRDFGRGIPFDSLVDCVSKINTGAKYQEGVFLYSIGLNGVGTKVVNALSSYFEISSYRNKKIAKAVFKKGILISFKEESYQDNNGTEIIFIPDKDIFKDYSLNYKHIEKRIYDFAYINKNIVFYFDNIKIHFKNGLFDYIKDLTKREIIYDYIYYEDEKLLFILNHTELNQSSYFSYVNNQHTKDGGVHLIAFKEAILKSVNIFFQKSFMQDDLKDGIVALISIKLKNPIFESQIKTKLGNNDIKNDLIDEIVNKLTLILSKNKIISDKLLNKLESNKNKREEINKFKKEIKKNKRKSVLNISSLKDCKYHFNKKENNSLNNETQIFITEGQSASGNIVTTRDPLTQAVFSLRGKIFNVFGKKFNEIMKNEELFNLIKVLGIDKDINDLRYSKIIIATDADNDGFHIRNLILTFFLMYFKDLIKQNKIFILNTPLFRIKNKENIFYCYSEKEKNIIIKDLNNFQITRFKGLGEISPREFKGFIKNLKLINVNIDSENDIELLNKLSFFMGKNTIDRRDYIINNLIIDE